MTAHQIPMRWTGEAMEPLRGYAGRCNEQFVVGQVYTIQAEEPRSLKSHRRFFAGINECWQSLPDHLSKQFPTPDHFRKRGLVATGYCTITQIACASNAEAVRVAGLAGSMDGYAVATVERNIATIAQPESQSFKAMGRVRFHESVEAVEAWAADILGTTPEAVRATREAA